MPAPRLQPQQALGQLQAEIDDFINKVSSPVNTFDRSSPISKSQSHVKLFDGVIESVPERTPSSILPQKTDKQSVLQISSLGLHKQETESKMQGRLWKYLL
jgi:hypothetical protein